MKPKRLIFHPTPLFGHTLRCGVPMVLGFMVFFSGIDAEAGDILRGGAGGGAGGKPRPGAQGGAPTPAATDAARANARDTLAKTTRTLQSIRDMQAAARQAAIKGQVKPGKNQGITLPKVPNGLGTGGLKPTGGTTKPSSWVGAKNPTQTSKNGKVTVTIEQTQQQALLKWDSFNVGKKTTLNFDQSAGGADAGKWIAFNQVTDPSANPTQILGNITADGQVYIINPNGIIFGGSSRVNARGLTVSSLPINENLIERGLLNNPDAQFLFSGLKVSGGSGGTPDFVPGPPPANGYGDVVVEAGAILKSPSADGGNGGRIMLVGPNVENRGLISTEAGQTVLAAGLQVGVAAHDNSDPSLRGLDVWVGEVNEVSGKVTNSGLIEAYTGSVVAVGREIKQLGAIESSTSVNLNGRIDLKASYGAVSNPNFDSTTDPGSGGPLFFNQFTGTVTMGEGSSTRILPDYASKRKVPGTSLSENSQVNIEGLDINFEKNAILFAPSGDVALRAGTWPYRDADGNRSILDENGVPQAGLSTFHTGATQRFFFNEGNIRFDSSSIVSVAGSVDVLVPLAHSILEVQLRGPELADSPLQRDSDLRGKTLTVDIRQTGTHNGKFWIGTPLGDVVGLAGLIERNAAQLTVKGGNIQVQAGSSVVIGNNAKLDVSGGFSNHQGGTYRTSVLVSNGKLIPIENATPDLEYDGVFNPNSPNISEKWGINEEFAKPFQQGVTESAYVEGAAAGTLSITAPSMTMDGQLRGTSITGERQGASPPAAGRLNLVFESEKQVDFAGATQFIRHSPSAPDIVFSRKPLGRRTSSLVSTEDGSQLKLSSTLLGSDGFGSLSIYNPDGDITVPAKVELRSPAEGGISLAGANLTIHGSLLSAGGDISLSTFNISPSAANEYRIFNPTGSAPLPEAVEDRGHLVLGKSAKLSSAGAFIDESGNPSFIAGGGVIDGGAISISSFSGDFAKGSVIDVSGGAFVSSSAKISYGKGGSISIATGRDASFSAITGGNLALGSTLMGYSGSTGGSVSLQAGLIRIGGKREEGTLFLGEGFFRNGGFSKFALTGIGAATGVDADGLETYAPAIRIAEGTRIEPVTQSLVATGDPVNGGFTLERTTYQAGVRPAASLSFSASNTDDPFTLETLEIRGDIVMEAGSRIVTDPGGSVTFNGATVSIEGGIVTPGGNISISGASAFPFTAAQRLRFRNALPTVHIGADARLSTAGTTVLLPDSYSRRVGKVYAGGTITVSGNIVAEAGSRLDVSGTSGVLDLDPAAVASDRLPIDGAFPNATSLITVRTRIDSNGGTIDLRGAQMLLTDATLVGRAGGSTATGGQLSVGSGRFYEEGATRTGADINLIVSQSGNALASGAFHGIGQAVSPGGENVDPNSGFFALDRFLDGGFDSLSLGGNDEAGASPIPFGGNVDFRGPIDLTVAGRLRLAAGGVVRADDVVNISASYLHLGQRFRQPEHPDDVFIPFLQDPAAPSAEYLFSPTTGNGDLRIRAGLVDVGTTSLQNIGAATIAAIGGDIRGNGTLGIAGSLTLEAAQIYPTTLARFDIFAYDSTKGEGRIEVRQSGSAAAPLSAGGSLGLFATTIIQGGVLRAPLGTIRLGWSGSEADRPIDIVAKDTIAPPIAREVILGDGSLTSVSAKGLLIPFGVSPDGLTWIDPRGVNVTLSGLPRKSVVIDAASVEMNPSAVVDLRGGGDLFATRWIPGNGGSRNLLGSPSASWGAGASYEPGDLVTFNGETWSARVRHSGQTPGANLYWSKVAESFAIVPTLETNFSPYNPFNTGANSSALAGNPGYVSSSLKIGDTITLEESTFLPAGTYTLLPRAYAVMKGALLVTLSDTGSVGSVVTPEGAAYVSGYRSNHFNPTESATAVRSRFELAPSTLVRDRAEYEVYNANKFIAAAGGSQDLPRDAGNASFNGTNALRLQGILRAQAAGRGAWVDISSGADIVLSGNNSSTSGAVTLNTGILNSWGVESLLIGGIRGEEGSDGTKVDVRTNSITLDNGNQTLTGPDVILVSRSEVNVAAGAAISSSGSEEFTASTLLLDGNGALLRVSQDTKAGILRTGVTGTTSGQLTIGDSASIRGNSVILDSSSAMVVSPEGRINGDALTLSSGQISLVFDGAIGFLDGSVVDNHLALTGDALANIQKTGNLRLQSYSSIDFYGSGNFGGAGLGSITFSTGGLRGFRQGSDAVSVAADTVRFENVFGAPVPSEALTFAGDLRITSKLIELGGNPLGISGFTDVTFAADSGIRFEGTGSLSTAGNLTTRSPAIVGATAASYQINAGGVISLSQPKGTSTLTSGLGASLAITGSSISADTDIALPSGSLSLVATSGPLEVGGKLSVAGASVAFGKLIRYTDGGSILLHSASSDVTLSQQGSLSVSSATGGGSAGKIQVIAPAGSFINEGSIEGKASTASTSGSFDLDVGILTESGLAGSFDSITGALETGGFHRSQAFRVRSGDVEINGRHQSTDFRLSTDLGSITVNGSIDASGPTGGSISLSAWLNLTLADGAKLSVQGKDFNSAGKGGAILLEAGTQRDGFANTLGMLDIQSGSSIDLGVDAFKAGDWKTPGSSAFEGKFTGTLHLRAPRTDANNDLNIITLGGSISGASSIFVEGFKTYADTGGILDIGLRDRIHQDSLAFLGASGVGNANEANILGRLLNGRPADSDFARTLLLGPGVEIINTLGDLVLGLANNSPSGSSNPEALAAADWDLSGFRYGTRGAPGVLTMRAAGDIVFNNSLSDGFVPLDAADPNLWEKGHSTLWLANLGTIREDLPVNTQSWSYRLTAGADVTASDFRTVNLPGVPGLTQPGKGSIIVGEFHGAVPNTISSGLSAGIGSEGQTADTIRISSTTTDLGNRFEVIRTGTGDITLNAGRDVQLRNPFSTIYTAGVALPDPGTVIRPDDFVVPIMPTSEGRHPSQSGGVGVTLGEVQQLTQPAWSMAGGNISIQAANDIGRFTLVEGILTPDSSRQLPNNWLYRRGHVDSSTGVFAAESGFGSRPDTQSAEDIHDTSPSTTWWIDYSNFFQGVGTLGGGNIVLNAGNDVINVDAVAPTNARMPGRMTNPDYVPGSTTEPQYLNLKPDASTLRELGGGDVNIIAGRNIDGGIYYVERGQGSLFAGGAITTNAARSPSLGILDGSAPLDPLTWLPTTLFVGKSTFNVAARGDVLLGPVTNPFLLPQGVNNKFWYKTYFQTYSEDAGADVSSYGGAVTHRFAVNLPDGTMARPVLDAWMTTQNLFTGDNSAFSGSNYQPWIRLAELDLSTFSEVFSLGAPNLRSTSFSGDINIAGDLTLFPSKTGDLELAAAGGISGLQQTGQGNLNGKTYQVWTYADLNLSDADPDSIPGISNPLAYQTAVGADRISLAQSSADILQSVTLALQETGSTSGLSAASAVKEALHDSGILHRNDSTPVSLHASGGDITGLTLFSPKKTTISAENDISDISFYLQNTNENDISLVSAGGDIIPFSENSPLRTIAADPELGNLIGDPLRATVAGNSTNAMAGDIQINGPGVLEVLAGGTIDLGTGANFTDGTSVGITSLGNLRNPYLPFGGADLIVLAGTTAADGEGAAEGLSSSSLDFTAFIEKYFSDPKVIGESAYLEKIGFSGDFAELGSEQQAIASFGKFYQVLRDAGRRFSKVGNYKTGFKAIKTLFGTDKPAGDILTRAREIRSVTGGSISLAAPGGGVTMASSIFGNPLTPPGIVTEYGGNVSTFTDQSVGIGQARVFTLRGGDIIMWSSRGDIAAGTSPKTVVTAPPTRVVIDVSSADVQTDLGGLATGGGIGVLAAVQGVEAGNVDLIAPRGTIDAGDAGIRVTGNLNISAQVVLNSSNISAGGSVAGAAPAAVSAPSISTTVAASNTAAATNATVTENQPQEAPAETPTVQEIPSEFQVEVIGYGGGSSEEEEDENGESN